jgi:hypothetical protein
MSSIVTILLDHYVYDWVSSLAYPNLLGTKGYVVVVVVIIMFMTEPICSAKLYPFKLSGNEYTYDSRWYLGFIREYCLIG